MHLQPQNSFNSNSCMGSQGGCNSAQKGDEELPKTPKVNTRLNQIQLTRNPLAAFGA